MPKRSQQPPDDSFVLIVAAARMQACHDPALTEIQLSVRLATRGLRAGVRPSDSARFLSLQMWWKIASGHVVSGRLSQE
jgi:hypothetical protein